MLAYLGEKNPRGLVESPTGFIKMILKLLWKQQRIVWDKLIIPRALHIVGGVLIPKEKKSSELKQLLILYVEGKVIFCVAVQRLASYLESNSFRNTMMQKVRIPHSTT